MATLTYKVDGKGGVRLTMTTDQGMAVSIDVTEHYAKQKAWAILADLDPAEVELAAEVACDPASVSDAEVNAALVDIPTDGSSIKDKILLAVAEGASCSLQVTNRLGLRREAAAPRLNELAKGGLLVVLRRGRGRGAQSFYGLSRNGVIRARRLGLPLTSFAPVAGHA